MAKSAALKSKGDQSHSQAPSIAIVFAMKASNFNDAQSSVHIVGSVHPENVPQPRFSGMPDVADKMLNLSGSIAGLMLGGAGRGAPHSSTYPSVSVCWH